MAVIIPSSSSVNIPSSSFVRVSTEYSFVSAVGGNVVYDVKSGDITYRVHTFTSSGILTVTAADNGVAPVEYLCVAGGGTGVAGGAGGFLTGTVNLNINSYVVTVGGASSPSYVGLSTAGPYIVRSFGGGNFPGGSGGSGAGGSGGGAASPGGAGTPGQGFPGAGGTGGPSGGPGGGGGAGGTGGGGAPSGSIPGVGGIGVISSITGYAQYYAGGGGTPPGLGGAGANTGGGGGNSGIVIIRYRI